MLILTLLSSLLIQTVLVNAQCGTLGANQICCNNKIKTIPSDNKGPACCGDNVYNKLKQICCNGFISPVKSLFRTVCCNNVVLDTWIEKCCDNIVRTIDFLNKRPACCGSQIYNLDKSICCEDKFYTQNTLFGPACCGDQYYETNKAQCCNNQVISIIGWTKPGCCNNVPFNGTNIICCQDNLVSTQYYGNPKCCGKNIMEGRTTTVCCGSKAYPFGDWTFRYVPNGPGYSFTGLNGYYAIANGNDIKNYLFVYDKSQILIYDGDWNYVSAKSIYMPFMMLKVDNDIYLSGYTYFNKIDANLVNIKENSLNNGRYYTKIFFDSSNNQLLVTYGGSGIDVFDRGANFVKNIPIGNGGATGIVKRSDYYYVSGTDGLIRIYGNNFNYLSSLASGCSGYIVQIIGGTDCIVVGCISGEIYTISWTPNYNRKLFYSGYNDLRGFDLDPKGRNVIYTLKYFYVKTTI